MTVYLLDTNIVSKLAPTRRRSESDEELAAWIDTNGDDLRLSAVTAAEIRDRIEKARRTGAIRKAAAYVDRELEIIDGIKRGVADAAAGRVVRHDEAMAEIYDAIDAAEAKRAGKG